MAKHAAVIGLGLGRPFQNAADDDGAGRHSRTLRCQKIRRRAATRQRRSGRAALAHRMLLHELRGCRRPGEKLAINWGDGSSASIGTITSGYRSTVRTPVAPTCRLSPPCAAALRVGFGAVRHGWSQLPGTVGTFTDTNPSGTASDFIATIDWGDGTLSLGTIIASPGQVSISGTHTYAEEG